MVKLTENLDEIANKYNKTKDSKYKDQWYKLVKEFANGPHNTKRRIVSVSSCHKNDNGEYLIIGQVNCIEMCEILRLKLTGYVDTLNLHIMNDGSGSMVGCMCR